MSKLDDLKWAVQCDEWSRWLSEPEAFCRLCKQGAMPAVRRGQRLIDAALVRVLREAPRGLVER